MPNVLYSGFGATELNQIHSALKVHVHFEPVYVLAQSIESLSIDFDGAVKHEIFDSRNGNFPKELSLLLRGPSTDEIDEYLNNFKEIAIAMMGRQSDSSWDFSFSEREHFFYMLACYWEQVLLAKKIDIAISRNVPHFASEYILAKLCEYKGIPFVQADYIAALDRMYFISSLESRSISSKFFNAGSDESDSAVKEVIKKHLLTYNQAKADYYLKTESLRQQAQSWRFLLKEVARLIYSMMKLAYGAILKRDIITRSNLKRNQSPVYLPNSVHNIFSLNLHKWKVRYRIYRNKVLYSKMITRVNLNEKYVLFAPNYQPERTTMPDGGHYYDVLRVLGILSSVLPEGWKIFYKEHSSVFNWPGDTFYRGHLFRNEEFYFTLNQFDRVVCVDADSDTFELIDNAQAVCCITGTIAYQSSIRGVKSIIFGNSWMCDCELIHKFKGRDELHHFLNFGSADNALDSVDIWSNFLTDCWSKSFPKVDLLSSNTNKEEYVSCLVKFITNHDLI